MKEIYFTLNTIDTVANEMITGLDPLRKRREIKLSPQDSALLILDMQRYFLEESSHAFIPSAKAIIPNIRMLQEKFLGLNAPVIHTQHLNTQDNAMQMKVWWKDLITAENPYASIIDDIADTRAVSISKTQYDAFMNTPLERLLKEKGIRTVVITGVMSHLCCETTARSAFMRGFNVFFAIDATATYHRNFHMASLLNLSHGFSVPALSKEIDAGLNTGESSKTGTHI